MPILGFGVLQILDPEECERGVVDALEAGQRLIDTAAAHMNEEAVGQGVLRWLVQRGIASLAKTVRKERMAENPDVFDVQRNDSDMARIAALGTGASSFFSHRDPAMVKWLNEARFGI